jgi:hypothetical protein
MGLLILPPTRNSVWSVAMGLSFETLIAWHRALGNLFLALIMVHVACWYRHCNPLMYPSFSTDISVRSVGMAWEPTGYFGGGHLTAHPHRQHKTLTQTLIEPSPTQNTNPNTDRTPTEHWPPRFRW